MNQDRLPPLPDSELDDAQREAQARISSGPRGALFGPFVPLLRSPEAMTRLHAMLTERGLSAAVEELTARCPIPVALDLDRARGSLPGPVESTGYFIVAEALSNAIKHAQASVVDVRLVHADGELRVEISDDVYDSSFAEAAVAAVEAVDDAGVTALDWVDAWVDGELTDPPLIGQEAKLILQVAVPLGFDPTDFDPGDDDAPGAGVDLTAGGTLNDSTIIQNLLTSGRLQTD